MAPCKEGPQPGELASLVGGCQEGPALGPGLAGTAAVGRGPCCAWASEHACAAGRRPGRGEAAIVRGAATAGAAGEGHAGTLGQAGSSKLRPASLRARPA